MILSFLLKILVAYQDITGEMTELDKRGLSKDCMVENAHHDNSDEYTIRFY